MSNLATKILDAPDIAGPIVKEGGEEKLLAISEMSDLFDVTLRTLRFYEEKGLLNPVRKGARRYYRPHDVSRMKVILQAKKIGLTLGEIRRVIAIVEGNLPRIEQLRQLRKICADQEGILREHQAQVDEQITEMQGVVASLDTLIDTGGDAA
ncbi:MerR family transcriptional regulator [Stappia sp. GBMRC 2046]|uniref:MerR family transcriptional regulator n=1 Tax=Stappia sediminis TaxID=2692190 RepID=A0A7X3LQV4_9HYPH|nr:MerR family transcriptional regulator [Stappia sediminis]MXN63428.1 MerR family transcriptional regulator [Stappia sediminis]